MQVGGDCSYVLAYHRLQIRILDERQIVLCRRKSIRQLSDQPPCRWQRTANLLKAVVDPAVTILVHTEPDRPHRFNQRRIVVRRQYHRLIGKMIVQLQKSRDDANFLHELRNHIRVPIRQTGPEECIDL